MDRSKSIVRISTPGGRVGRHPRHVLHVCAPSATPGCSKIISRARPPSVRAATVAGSGGDGGAKAKTREEGYEAGGNSMLNGCDVLLAIWDGR
jgi:hypothetical protein